MADIEKYGGKVIIAAASLPNMRTITINSKPSWISGDSSVHGNGNANWVGTVGANTYAEDRSGSISATVTTDVDSSYQGTASMTCGWTVTQAGTGSTPPAVNRYVTIHATFSSSTSNLNTVSIRFYADGNDTGDSSTWQTNSTYDTNSEDLNVGDSSAATITASIGVDVPPYNGYYRVEIQSGSYHQEAYGGGSLQASAQIGPIQFNGNQYIDVYVLLTSELS